MLLWRHAFEKRLKESLGENLKLVWTANRRVMISLRRVRGLPVVRLHESFASAGASLRDDLIRFLIHGRRVPKSVRDFVRDLAALGEQKKITPVTRGKYHDLRKIYRKLNREYFDGKLKATITWGRGKFGGGKRSITFGSYVSAQRLIRIHPILDTEVVPPWFLESVVHHEMAHEYLDMVEGAGRKRGQAHTPRFRELERRFKYYALSAAWEKRHLQKLLHYRPRVKK